MKVLLVGNYAHDDQPSMQRFSSAMERGLLSAGHEVEMCTPPPVVGRIWPGKRGIGKWLGYVDKLAAFPPILRCAVAQADVVHICDHSNAFYVRHLRRKPHVVTCHDMIGIRGALDETPLGAGWTGKLLQHMILAGLKRAQHIACVSQATCSDLLRIARLPERRVSRVFNGLHYPYSPMPSGEACARLRRLEIDPAAPFLLHVGGNHWYKNRLGVLKIFAAICRRSEGTETRLVMAGQAWANEMREFVSVNGLQHRALEIPNPSDEDLRALYSVARVMLFPSLEEGFGWPIVEAQACGCTVVTSNRSPMKEVGGDAAVYVDPEDIEGAAATVKAFLENGRRHPEDSINNARRFTTEQMIDGYVRVYERILHEYA